MEIFINADGMLFHVKLMNNTLCSTIFVPV